MSTATPVPTRGRKAALVVGLLAAGGVAGAVLAGTLSASAASDSTTSSGQAPAYGSAAPASGAPTGDRSANPVRSDEKSVSSDVAAKLKAAALEAVPGGTVYRVETDAGDAAYEAHMTKADGSLVTVKFDENLAVTKVEDGMGSGDPAPRR